MVSRSNVTGIENKKEKKKENKSKGTKIKEREKEKKREKKFGIARTEIVSFQEWEACISLRGVLWIMAFGGHSPLLLGC